MLAGWPGNSLTRIAEWILLSGILAREATSGPSGCAVSAPGARCRASVGRDIGMRVYLGIDVGAVGVKAAVVLPADLAAAIFREHG